MSSSLQPDGPQYGSGDSSKADSSFEESIESSIDENIDVSHGSLFNSSQNGAYAVPIDRSAAQTLRGSAGLLTKLVPSGLHLPDLDTHQHSTLFYLSLVEGRCRTQAAGLLNESRHPTQQLTENHAEVGALSRSLFAEISKELHKAGIIPDDFAGQDLEQLRGRYLNTFDTALQNIAARARHSIPNHSVPGSTVHPDELALAGPGLFSDIDKMAKHDSLTGRQPSLLSSLILRGSTGDQMPNSLFQTQYGPKSLLGKGGFGHVYRVKNLVDDREYAIKRIVMRSKKSNLPANKNQHQTILTEARSLSKLNHANIVRYYGAWVETCPAGTRLDGDTSSAEVS